MGGITNYPLFIKLYNIKLTSHIAIRYAMNREQKVRENNDCVSINEPNDLNSEYI